MENSEGYNTIMSLANDLESLGYYQLTTEQLKQLALSIETELITTSSGFHSAETIEDFNM